MDALIEKNRHKILEVARQRGARSIKLFGSMATGQATSLSDIDFLVEMETGRSAFDLGGLQLDLEELLGRHVDMTTPAALHPSIRDRVLQETVDV